jgi:hypothetical protein
MEPLESTPIPWAQRGRLQCFFWFTSTFKVFNNSGNLLFAQRQPKSAQCEGFCHGFATVDSDALWHGLNRRGSLVPRTAGRLSYLGVNATA